MEHLRGTTVVKSGNPSVTKTTGKVSNYDPNNPKTYDQTTEDYIDANGIKRTRIITHKPKPEVSDTVVYGEGPRPNSNTNTNPSQFKTINKNFEQNIPKNKKTSFYDPFNK